MKIYTLLSNHSCSLYDLHDNNEENSSVLFLGNFSSLELVKSYLENEFLETDGFYEIEYRENKKSIQVYLNEKSPIGDYEDRADYIILENELDEKLIPEKFTFFWGGPFSQWHKSAFKDEKGQVFNCAEQYMMYHKAITFKDQETADKVLETSDPRKQKALGRKVKNFSEYEWSGVAIDIVYHGNKLKFSQNPELKEILMATKGTTLVEASPYDKIWGIGLKEDDPKAQRRNTWEGFNWLGETLTRLREDFEMEVVES